MPRSAIAALLLLVPALPAGAAEIRVAPGPGALAAAVAAAAPGDMLLLEPGRHDGPVTIDRPLVLDGGGAAVVDGGGKGTVITITGADAVIRGLEVRGSGTRHEEIDSGIKLAKGASGALIENNLLVGNLHGVDVHGATDTVVRGNTVIGRQDQHMNSRGNAFYIWNAPGTVIEGNNVRYGRDGIFSNASRDGTYRNNLFRDLRFAVHYMYTHNSIVSGNVSVGNTLGYALMYSNRIEVQDNLSLRDRRHGLMLNYANNADVQGNLVRGGAEKCTFIYNAHRNLIVNNRFEGCDIGIHFTAGSERNVLTGNAFIGNRTQVKYVGTRDIEWSFEGRGNFWSDHPVFDLNSDGIADSRFRPNDLMDHILWSQPAAALLMGAPAVQLIRWSQSSFPATLPGGVVDSFPLTAPATIEVPAEIAAFEAAAPLPSAAGMQDDADYTSPLADH
ncbi:nitrous oxide reductase family maturation protein NosD [Ruixingdingia sedimenti]|uniref:Nitrous oxide reductase family maturation protein NosD n=1 Tax=Ruixingdingia sedimenti TaxID=3073604 RepID=A0ABU1FAL8_9RHOB|nr:nitrous oxide reductase family maturation protein NosD [Xinfangfangia sp. LG-4]MDR5653638.1 nitrous oxide reductase family maturation protein NosD [Xinfangfangia sp. LG-4]